MLPLSFADRTLVALTLTAGTVILTRRSPELRAAIALALVASAANAYFRASSAPVVVPTRTQRFAATVIEARAATPPLFAYVLALDRGPRVLAAVTRRVAPGSHVLVRGRLEPLDLSRNPGAPSERSIEGEHGVAGRLSSANILQVDAVPARGLAATLARAHAWALQALRAHLAEPGASIVAGELWGERAALPPDLRREFQETGTVHVLVTAGLHVALIAWLFTSICAWLTLPRAASCAIGIGAVWIFAWFSGAHLPSLRAASMATAFLLARAAGRSTLSWNALALAAIAMTAMSPASVGMPSFWLSFCCVGAIFALLPSLERAAEPLNVPQRLREPLLLTVATQLGTWPITSAVFLQFSSYATVANVAVVPLVPVTMLLGILQLALTPLPSLAQAAANVNAWALSWSVGAVRTLSALPHAVVPTTPAPTWCIALYEAALLAAAPLAARGAPTLAVAFVLTAGSLVISPPLVLERSLRITVLDVGQADSIVIETPARHVLLVDAGGRLERGPSGSDSIAERVGDRIVVPFLLREGIHRVDAVIVSHPHGDHAGGCAPVLRRLGAAEVADSGQTYGGHAYHDCIDTARAARVPLVYPRAGDIWRTNDGVTLTFIGPSLPLIGGRNAINDNSVAFVLQYGAFRMLFTGDAGVAAERRFLREGVDLHADILKVGHHGSAYSSSPAFIAAVHPTYAIISVGRHNIFGHPAPSTVARLKASGAKVYRTDRNGAVVVTSDGRSPPHLQRTF